MMIKESGISLLFMGMSMVAAAQVPEAPKDVNGVVDNTPDSIAQAMTARPVPGSSRVGTNPVLFLIGLGLLCP